MEVDTIKIAKFTKEEREHCIKEGLCLRCRKKGHMARNCPAFPQGKPTNVRKVEEVHETFDEEATIGKVAITIAKDF